MTTTERLLDKSKEVVSRALSIQRDFSRKIEDISNLMNLASKGPSIILDKNGKKRV